MSEELRKCPFCHDGETQIRENTHWTGMSNQIHSVVVMHWCIGTPLRSFLQIKGKTREEAVSKWNRVVSK